MMVLIVEVATSELRCTDDDDSAAMGGAVAKGQEQAIQEREEETVVLRLFWSRYRRLNS